MTGRAVVFSGTGRYSDPWHPFDDTSAALADIARGLGWEVEVRPSEPASLEDLGGVGVLVVNSGGGDPAAEPAADPAWERGFSAVAAHARAGGAVYAVHTASNTFPDWPGWPDLLGGRWVRGTSWHPERCVAAFEAAPGAEDHPVFDGIDPLEATAGTARRPCVVCYDERYSRLTVHPGSQPLLRHETGEAYEVCAWLAGRVLYDGLGHDARSYESPSRRRFVANGLRFLAG